VTTAGPPWTTVHCHRGAHARGWLSPQEQGVGVLLTVVDIGRHGDKIELVMRSKGGGGKGLEGDTIQVWRR
jgi:hypothetical protein